MSQPSFYSFYVACTDFGQGTPSEAARRGMLLRADEDPNVDRLRLAAQRARSAFNELNVESTRVEPSEAGKTVESIRENIDVKPQESSHPGIIEQLTRFAIEEVSTIKNAVISAAHTVEVVVTENIESLEE
mmetsp:Transcript_22387/g.36993  ORF Transcript_22387/g.36993 Transcript_22387/m.36993 type:complete len:131 (+) Transcript_22387:133-525(+)|eukprot:CAMPEP_0184655912 /NCGR_PEP_ID=MMETSP0308-20130426/14914_1 /TAXON_ID=38269 /ORGANISM="Gloeochaete witrockiana, Strain SAG 46.84" /LENGTH=130 /DNA_ID=CAMNT_0027092731 /DNA_START=110 /DNA_END=502 /DNA_ORIENTATION=-